MVIQRKGDVYINDIKKFGQSMHLSLHASGKNSIKLGKDRQKVVTPIQIGSIWIAFRYHFRAVSGNLPVGSADTEKSVIYLGWPRPLHYLRLDLVYAFEHGVCKKSCGGKEIFSDIPVRFLQRSAFISGMLTEFPLTMKDLASIASRGVNEVKMTFGSPVSDLSLEIWSYYLSGDGVPTATNEPFNYSPEQA